MTETVKLDDECGNAKVILSSPEGFSEPEKGLVSNFNGAMITGMTF